MFFSWGDFYLIVLCAGENTSGLCLKKNTGHIGSYPREDIENHVKRRNRRRSRTK
jgi:hypothetical protein